MLASTAAASRPPQQAAAPVNSEWLSEDGGIRPYVPRQPEDTILCRVVHDELDAFIALAEERYQRPLPRYVIKAFRAYDIDGLLSTVTDADGNVTTIVHDIDGNPVAIESSLGPETLLTVDASGYLSSITDPGGSSHAFAYGDGGLMETHTTPAGYATTFDYDGEGRLINDSGPGGGSLSLSRVDTDTNITVEATTALGRATSCDVGGAATGQTRTNTFASGLSATIDLQNDGTRGATLPNGVTVETTQEPDPRFGMLAPTITTITTTPAGLQQGVVMTRTVTLADDNDPFSLLSLTETTTINGRISTSNYDPGTMMWTTTTPEGRTRTRTIDSTGRTIESTVAGVLPITSTYDVQGRLAATAQGTRSTTHGYGPDGWLEAITDPLLQTTAFGRDTAGRVLTTVRPDGQIVQQSYDLNGNVISVTPPAQPAHSMSYGPVDLLTTYNPPDAGFTPRETTWDYNLDKLVDLLTQPDNKTLGYGYDFAGRLSTLATPTETRTRTYDPITGMLSSIATPEVTLSYQYDGDLMTGTTWSGAVSGTVSLSYDDDFRVATETVNASDPVAIGYDLDSLLVQAGDLTVTRDVDNGLVTSTVLGQLNESFTYSGYGEPESYAATFGGTDLYATTYVRDDLGRITEKTEAVEGVTTLYGYSYDLAGRLVEVTIDGILESAYDYDDNGNRLTHTTSEDTTVGSYDTQDRLLSYGPLDFTYTENGEWSSRTDIDTGDITGYQYDIYGNLTTTTLPSGTVIEYVVDGTDRRVLKKVDGVIVKGWLYRDDLRPIAELDAAGTVVARFVYALEGNVPDYMVKEGNTYRFVTDQLGTVRLVVDVATGSVAQRIDYDAWGVVLTDSNPGFQPFGFAGGIYDPDTGQVRFGARDYDAETGRWTAKDPILFDGDGTNLYLYALGDPINLRDIWGHSASECPLSRQKIQCEKRYSLCRTRCFNKLPTGAKMQKCFSCCHTARRVCLDSDIGYIWITKEGGCTSQ